MLTECVVEPAKCPREASAPEVLTNTLRLSTSDRRRVHLRTDESVTAGGFLRHARSPSAVASLSTRLARLTTTYKLSIIYNYESGD